MTTTDMTSDVASIVAGEARRGSTTSTSVNPANPAEIVSTISLSTVEIAAAAIETAADAFTGWQSTSAQARGEVLRGAGDLLDARAETIARDLTREEGKTLAEALRETQLAAKIFRYYAIQAIDQDGETYPSQRPDQLLFTRREPVGVVSVITPWNFPISLPSWKIAAALAFGNSVVWKPAEIVPRTAVHVATALGDAGLPAGVLNLVIGRGSQIGEPLVTHPDVGAVTFTGSNSVGQTIQSRAAAAGKKIQLELGGKNPSIVLAGADLEHAARQISIGAFGASGQKCTATSRVIVERSVAPELVEHLQEQADAWVLGDPLQPETTIGPVASAEQLKTVLGFIDGARREGARTVAGGGRPDGPLADGYFVAPTVFVDVEPSHAIAREEIFGPVAAVLPVDSYEEAIAEANNTPFGLTASLFTNDLSLALRFTREIRTGIVRVNQATSGIEYHVPFGGKKASGHGHRELGKAAREFFTETKTVYISGL
jgi:acyl-CoA reductase-like NAD-dependent aldehyde dehydrogenase